jgi:hypothetical protein
MAGVPTRLALSPSGRYLRVHTDHAHLIDLTDRSLRRTIELCGPAFGHASFTRGPGGEDVLFIAAKSYMAVQRIDCATGTTVRQIDSGFCHTDFELSADGTRLFCFGCTWAAPYSARIYDAATWSLVFEQSEGEMHHLGDVLPMRAAPGADGLVTCVTTVDLTEVPAPGSEDDVDLRDDDRADHSLLTDLQALAPSGPFAIVIRRIDPASGAVRHRFVHPDAPTELANLHTLPDHRVLLANRRIRLVDAVRGTFEDRGSIDLEDGARFATAVSGDVATIVALVR